VKRREIEGITGSREEKGGERGVSKRGKKRRRRKKKRDGVGGEKS
jgi:hypothetical protein